MRERHSEQRKVKFSAINVEELALLAEDILLGAKKIEDYAFLSEEELSKLKSLIHIGIDGLSAYSKTYRAKFHKPCLEEEEIWPEFDRHKVAALKRERKERQKRLLYSLAKRLTFQIFPMEIIRQEEKIVQSKVIEALSRKLGAADIALFCSAFSEEDIEWIFANISGNYIAEIQHHLQLISEEDLNRRFDAVAAKYSIIVSQALKHISEASKKLHDFALQYSAKLAQELKVYCINLFAMLSIEAQLEAFSEQDWKRFVGITPRKDLAAIHFVLPENFWKQIMEIIPFYQRDDLSEMAVKYIADAQDNLTLFIESADALKRAVSQIKKVRTMY